MSMVSTSTGSWFLPLRHFLPELVDQVAAALGDAIPPLAALRALLEAQFPSPAPGGASTSGGMSASEGTPLEALDVIGFSYLAVWVDGPVLVVEGVLDVLSGYEPRLPVPGLSQLSLVLTRLGRVRLSVSAEELHLDVHGPSVALRFDREWLTPVDDESGALFAEIELVELGWLHVDTAGSISFAAIPGGTLRFVTNNDPWVIGDTNVTLEVGELDVILDGGEDGTAAGPAVELTDATLRFSEDLSAPDGRGFAVALTGARVDATGFSGTASALFPDTRVDDPELPTRYVGTGAASFLGFQFGIQSIALELRQSRPVQSTIVGGIILPYFDQAARCTLSLTAQGRFTAAFADEVGEGRFVFECENLLSLAVDAVTVMGGGGEPALIEIAGRGQLKLPGVVGPPLAVRGLRIASDGTVSVAGSGIGLPDGSTVQLFGLAIEVGGVEFGTLPETGERWLSLSGRASAAGARSPITLAVERLRVLWRPETLRNPLTHPPHVDLAGLALAIEAGPVKGGGALFFDPQRDQYVGALQLDISGVGVGAVGILTLRLPTGEPGATLLVLLSAEGFAPVQLPFGFTLNGVGGLLGVNRTANVDALRTGVKGHTLDRILFPRDPVSNVRDIVRALDEAFPLAPSRFLFGPMALLGWGSPTLLTLELAVILELPRPVRLLLLGQLTALLPAAHMPQVELRMDALGVVDFERGWVALDATLYDSRILRNTLSGDMALRAEWRDDPCFLLAVGGFNPRFQAPPGFPALQRLSLNLATGRAPRLRLEAYLALTSNTVQLGANLHLYAEALGFSIEGILSFDALLQLSPFQLLVDVRGQLALKRGSDVLTAVYLEFALSGPAPWRARGTASIKLLAYTATVSFDISAGEPVPTPLPPAADLWPALRDALSDPHNWSALLPPDGAALVTLAPTSGDGLRAHPRGVLTVRQRVLPLGVEIDRFGSAPISGARRFTISGAYLQNPAASVPFATVSEYFAAAQFRDMKDDEKLSRPSFELMAAGVRLAADTRPLSAYELTAVGADITYGTSVFDPEVTAGGWSELAYALPDGALAVQVADGAAGMAPRRRSGSGRYQAPPRGIALKDTTYVVAQTQSLTRQGVPGIPPEGASYTAAAQALNAYLASAPADRGRLHLVGRHEVS
jgi:hypothetical protein